MRADRPVDVPLTDENPDRASGVWVIDIETGRTVALVHFPDFVHEIFAVQVLPGKCYPHIGAKDGIEFETSWVLPQAAMKEVERATPTRLTAAK